MSTYKVEYWYRDGDEKNDYVVTVEANSDEEAIEKAKDAHRGYRGIIIDKSVKILEKDGMELNKEINEFQRIQELAGILKEEEYNDIEDSYDLLLNSIQDALEKEPNILLRDFVNNYFIN